MSCIVGWLSELGLGKYGGAARYPVRSCPQTMQVAMADGGWACSTSIRAADRHAYLALAFDRRRSVRGSVELS